MSRADKQRYLRTLVCDGCSRACRYADFRAFGRYAGGFAPKRGRDFRKEYRRRKELEAARACGEELLHGNSDRRHAGQLEFAVASADAFGASKGRVPVRKGRVLGQMFETKMQMWEHYTQNCPYREDAYDSLDTDGDAAAGEQL